MSARDWTGVNLPPRWRFIRRRSVKRMQVRFTEHMARVSTPEYQWPAIKERIDWMHGHPHVPDAEWNPVCCPPNGDA